MLADMRAFEVSVNGKRMCVAGIAGDDGVLTVLVDSVMGRGRDALEVSVGGLASATGETLKWGEKGLRVGDEVVVRVVEATRVTRPRERVREDAAKREAEQKRYVLRMAKKFGWRIVQGRGKAG